MKTTINFILNGEQRQLDVAPNETLLEVLRNKLGLKSPKCGCDRGDCGTCTVLLNHESVRSCLIFAIEVEEQEIITLEGLSKDGLTPLQEAFLKHSSFQCGFCAPGIILSATDLLNNNPHPTKEEVKEAIAGNLCRCTGYEPILDAIMELSEKDREGQKCRN
ncbi:MAG: (2Fe-2S)-binding protein [bacterium]|nr:(2Fe-2S)-binding protein [bacterium]